MKNLFLLVMLLSTSFMFASFPVNKANVENVKVDSVSEISHVDVLNINTDVKMVDNEAALTPIAASGYNKWVALAFWFFLGWPFAAHRWYAKKPVWANILFIVTFGGLGIWAIIDLINILTDNF